MCLPISPWWVVSICKGVNNDLSMSNKALQARDRTGATSGISFPKKVALAPVVHVASPSGNKGECGDRCARTCIRCARTCIQIFLQRGLEHVPVLSPKGLHVRARTRNTNCVCSPSVNPSHNSCSLLSLSVVHVRATEGETNRSPIARTCAPSTFGVARTCTGEC